MMTLLDGGRPAGQQVVGIRRPHALPAQVRAVTEQPLHPAERDTRIRGRGNADDDPGTSAAVLASRAVRRHVKTITPGPATRRIQPSPHGHHR
jgi:hypothetical protein